MATTPSFSPRIAASGSSVYVCWIDRRIGVNEDIYFNRSLDGGATWLPTDVRLDVGSAPGATGSFRPHIAASGSSVYVTWEEREGHPFVPHDIFFNRSLDGGTTWFAKDVRLDTGSAPSAADSEAPRIASLGSSVYVVWQDDRNGSDDIYFNRSLDSGTSWLPTDVRLDLGSTPGGGHSYEPQVAASGASVFVTWSDYRAPYLEDVYFNRSLDSGETWLPEDVRLDVGSSPGASRSLLPTIVASGHSVYVAWFDTRDSFMSDVMTDIYFNLALGFQPYGQGTPGSGGLVPTISGSGTASIGGAFSIDLANGLGGAVGVLAYGFDGPASIPLDGGIALVQPPLERMLVKLGGRDGAPGAGSTSVSFPVPDDLSLIGTRANFQARFLDPGTDAGFSTTGGLEAWIL